MLALSTTDTLLPVAPVSAPQAQPLTVQKLQRGGEAEVLAFLAVRPIHTVIMAGLIRDNGLFSPLNRGSFYACRDAAQQLVGIALIGHVTMLETQNDTALQIFAVLAQQQHQRAHALLGEQQKIERFWHFYAPAGAPMPRLCRELLFEQRWPMAAPQETVKLQQATLAELEQVVPIHAQMAFDECGVNPLQRDPLGFRQRIARRIEQGRVWIAMEEGRLLFKADVVSVTPEASYLEGIYINPEERGKGHGARFVSQLSRTLLGRTKAICLLVNEENQAAQACYLKAGFKLRGLYDTIFLQQSANH
jgi:uncharacterized protein